MKFQDEDTLTKIKNVIDTCNGKIKTADRCEHFAQLVACGKEEGEKAGLKKHFLTEWNCSEWHVTQNYNKNVFDAYELQYPFVSLFYLLLIISTSKWYRFSRTCKNEFDGPRDIQFSKHESIMKFLHESALPTLLFCTQSPGTGLHFSLQLCWKTDSGRWLNRMPNN